MGHGSTKIADNKDIVNKKSYKTAIHKSTELINKMSSSLLQEQLTTINTNNTADQEISFAHLKADGDVNITEIGLEQKIDINVSILTDSKMKQDLVNKMQQNITDNLKKMSQTSMSQLNDDSEKIFKEIAGAISDTVGSGAASLTGSKFDKSSTLNLQQILDIDQKTDLDNTIEQSVTTELCNRTVNSISDTFVGKQKLKIKDVESKKGAINISKINLTVMKKTVLDTVSKSGLSSGVLSNITGQSTSEITEIEKTEQEQKNIEHGTITDLTDGTAKNIHAAGDAGSKVIFYTMLPFLIGGVVLILVVGVLIYSFRGPIAGLIGGNKEKEEEEEEEKKEGDETGAKDMKGSGKSSGLLNLMIKKPKNSIFTIILIILNVVVLIMIFRDMSKMYLKKEKYYTESKIMLIDNIYYIGKGNDVIHAVTSPKHSVKVQYNILSNNDFVPKNSIKVENRRNVLPKNKIVIKKTEKGKDLYLKYNSKKNLFVFEQKHERDHEMFEFSYFYKKDVGYLISYHNTYLNISPYTRKLIGGKSGLFIKFKDI